MMLRTTRPLSIVIAATLAFAPLAMGAFALAPSQTASAADPQVVTWSVEPSQTADGSRRAFDYSVDPGTQIVDSFVVTNSGQTSAEFLIYATDAINDPDTGAFGLLNRAEKPTDLGSWITTSTDKLTIDPGMQAIIPFNLLIPSDATPGDHTAGVIASVLTKGESNGAAVQLEQRVAARVYMRVSGDIAPAVEVSGATAGFTAEINPFAPGIVVLKYNVQNTGNLRVDVNQTVKVTGPFGIPLGQYSPKAISNFLPRQTVRMTADIPSVAALFLAWSEITVVPGELGSAITDAAPDPKLGVPTTPNPTASPTAVPTPNPSGAATARPADGTGADKPLEFSAASSTVMTLAISWTLFALVVLVIAAIYFIVRYVRGTRERMYDAIDEAAAAAREEALGAAGATEARAQ
jgi:hypothetical protein